MTNKPEPADATNDEKIVRQIEKIVSAIPPGKAMSYGAVGKRCDPPISGYICGRIMGNAMKEVSWWRVVGKDGNLPIRKRHPELSAQQRELLEAEGVLFDEDGRVPMDEFGMD